jgi:Ca2+-binding EF-hand superfamily protein
MRTHGHIVLMVLAVLAALAPRAGAQTQEIQDAVDAKLSSQAAPLPADDDLGEAKPFVRLSEGKPASKDQAVVAAEGKPRYVEVLDYLDFVFVASDRPVLLRLHLRNNGQPYFAAWDGYMKKMYDYLDKNGDGVLVKAEAKRAPTIQFLQFHLQGSIGFPYQGMKNQMNQIDTNKDGKVSLAEFKEFYRRGGITPLQFNSNSNRASTDAVTNTIYNRLDSNKDGKLSAEEMARAETALQRLDLDENELLTAAELTPGGGDNNFGFVVAPPSVGMGVPNIDMGFLEIKPDTLDGVARQVLSHYDKDKNGKLSQTECGLDKPLFEKLDSNHDGQLDPKEFAGFFRRVSDLELIARVGAIQKKEGAVVGLLRKIGAGPLQAIRAEVFNPRKRSMPLAGKVHRVDPAALAFSFGDAHIGLTATDQQQFRQFPRQFFEQQFTQADTAKKGVVDRKQAMSAQFLSQIFDFVDRDGDGKVTRKELNTYLDMQTEGAECRMQLTIADEGRSLFELLDENGDGRLSIRELRSSWSRMKELVKDANGLSRQDVFRRLDVSVGPSQRRIRIPAGRPTRTLTARRLTAAPLWFQKMDRNQDGDISPREFVAGDEAFRRLDSDGDGLISREEAQQFEERLQKEKAKK